MESELRKITLDQLLSSRDERQAMEQSLIRENSGLTLIVLTVVMPGDVKRNSNSLIVAQAAVEALHKAFEGHIRYEKERDLLTGYEAFIMVNLPPEDVKRMACGIEDTHPLGRLFDIDVFTRAALPVSRTQVGQPLRRCLICGNAARVCMREQKHSYEELQNKVNQLIQDYVRGI